MKHCPKCKQTKSIDLFSNDKNRADGKQAYCRDCQREYTIQNKETRLAKGRAYWARTHPGSMPKPPPKTPEERRMADRARSQAYRSSNIEQVRERDRLRHQTPECQARRKAYHERTIEQRAARWQRYSAQNRERLNAKAREWHAANPERTRESFRQWRKNNPEKNRQRKVAYEARKAQAEGSYTQAEWKTMLDWFGNKCLCCGTTETVSVDHVVPLSSGGNNWIENLQPLCAKCNSAKRDKFIDYRDPIRLVAFFQATMPNLMDTLSKAERLIRAKQEMAELFS